MASLLSGLNPVKSFPEYHGPYAVGTVDVEIPAADIPSPSAAPEDAQPTIAFRIFYPCEKPASPEVDRPVRWIPQPQRDTMAALAKFLGLGERKANLFSYLPQQLYWITLHAHRNAQLLEAPTSNGRWPVTIFSHGLAGSRNAYSYICGDLASNGMIVIALDHRDGSSPIQYVRATATTEAHTVAPVKISHEPSDEVYRARDKQLRIRLWEISMAYEALMKIDAGHEIENLDCNTSKNRRERVEVLWQFDGKLDIHRAGKVTFCGHSFGAATIAQLVKSIHYAPERPIEAGNPLIVPNADAAIVHQIMPESPTLFLDMWCMPLQSPDQQFLWNRALPSHSSPTGPKGDNVLSILSEAFYNWEDNLNINKHIVAPPSRSRRASSTAAPRITREKGQLLPSWARLRAHSPSQDSGYVSEVSRSPARSLTRQRSRTSALTTPSSSAVTTTKATNSPDGEIVQQQQQQQQIRTRGPHVFYVQRSQHFNQSDFGILFPLIARKFTKAEEPERILELNTRAMVQVIREAGIEVAGGNDPDILARQPPQQNSNSNVSPSGSSSSIRRWIPVSVEEDDELLAATTAATVVDSSCGGGAAALQAVNRKLSVGSPTLSLKVPGTPKSPGRDGMTMGQKVDLAPLEI